MRLVPLIVAVVACALFAPVPAGAVDRRLGATLTKPVTSSPWSDGDVQGLARDLSTLLATSPALRGAHVGALVETPAGRILFAHDATALVQPASTLKLLVGSAALDRLGPAYRFRTTLARRPAPAGSGATEQLVLHGGGDPLLGGADLDAAALATARAGVTGPVDLLIDESHVAPSERRAPGWSVDDILQDYAPVIDGLPFEENVLAAYLDPTTLGAPATLRLVPPFTPQPAPVRSCPGGPTWLTFVNQSVTVPAGRPDTSDAAAGRCGEIVVRGDVPLGGLASLAIAVDAPELLARQRLIAALARSGIAVAPPLPSESPLPGVTDVPLTPAPDAVEVWRHDGEPLADLLADMWFPSDNLVAEELFHELDAAANRRPATAAGAATLERAWLREIGIDPEPITLADGSGLSQYDRATPAMLAAILVHDWNGPGRDTILDALPVAGVRGDLRSFGRGTHAVARVWAKTGSMMHVRGLAGYVASTHHGAVVFVLSIDDWPGDDASLDMLRSAFCARIANA